MDPSESVLSESLAMTVGEQSNDIEIYEEFSRVCIFVITRFQGSNFCIDRQVTLEGELQQNHPFGQPHASSQRKGSCRIEVPKENHRHHRPLKTNSGVRSLLHNFGNV